MIQSIVCGQLYCLIYVEWDTEHCMWAVVMFGICGVGYRTLYVSSCNVQDMCSGIQSIICGQLYFRVCGDVCTVTVVM